MKEFRYTITDQQGMHARPAGRITAVAKQFKSYTTLWTKEGSFDIKKLLQFMGSNVKCEDTIVVRVEGIDEEECAIALENAFKENL
ncbi:MAG: HPr family phosphocarrier protein [Firmicutes bacterium]|nr:HPr family phosphocarrier protein [Bacillota bacterium]